MKINQTPYRTIWIKSGNPRIIQIIDQRFLPHEFVIEEIHSLDEMIVAIRDMHLRGAPLIGVAAAYGMYLAALEASKENNFEASFQEAARKLKAARPTAVNLEWAIHQQQEAALKGKSAEEKIRLTFETAGRLADADVENCRRMGEFALPLFEEIAKRKPGKAVNVLTHCNAGWLACVDWGTATSAIYQAHDRGIPVHVWVDETRPRNQGSQLTAWELGQHGVPHTIIVDNAGGHLMQHAKVDLVIVGTDRTTRSGDVANKIGTYLKALAAFDNRIPFYAAVPSSSIDWNLKDGIREIPIEERSPDEVRFIEGFADGKRLRVLSAPEKSPASNYGFDVTPARLITGLITERGICFPNEQSLSCLFPEKS
ncbi:MAG: S-methyl-5-thioribose-1-phosphate isomerase [Candidatus Omnitrophica bacterium]|nr:S-methyl-5-thioribose-1-phosphate isomerase [Candidatus Omnitrophota bacterium]